MMFLMKMETDTNKHPKFKNKQNSDYKIANKISKNLTKKRL